MNQTQESMRDKWDEASQVESVSALSNTGSMVIVDAASIMPVSEDFHYLTGVESKGRVLVRELPGLAIPLRSLTPDNVRVLGRQIKDVYSAK